MEREAGNDDAIPNVVEVIRRINCISRDLI